VGISKIVAAKAGAAEGLTSAEAGYTWGWGAFYPADPSAVFRINLLSLFSGAPSTSESSRSVTESRSQRRRRQRPRKYSLLASSSTTCRIPGTACCHNKPAVPYRHAKLVLFRDYTDSGCGTAQSATGPFYCPVDEKVYIDLAFFDELRSRFGAPGRVSLRLMSSRTSLGITCRKSSDRAAGQQPSPPRPSLANPLSVKLELQADCSLGGVGHSTEQRKIVDSSDVAAGIQAAASVGDDRLQRMATGHVSPEDVHPRILRPTHGCVPGRYGGGPDRRLWR